MDDEEKRSESIRTGARIPTWWLPLAALAIIVGSSITVWMLNEYTRTRVEAQSHLAHLAEEAGEQVVLAHDLTLQEGVSGEHADEDRENRVEIEEVAEELGRISPGSRSLARVEETYGAFEAALDDEIRLVEDGRIAEAREVLQTRVDPNFEAHRDAINAAQEEYEKPIRTGELAASIGTGALALFAMAAVGILFLRYQSLRRERALQERFRSLVQNASDIITIVGADDRVRYESPSLERVLGYPPEEMLGREVLGPELVHIGDAGKRDHFIASLREPGSTAKAELRLRSRDGSWRYFELIGQNLLHDPNLGGVVINSRDTTERRALEERLRYQALHDSLTNLPNRTLFMDRIGHALARTRGRQGSTVAVLFVDLDRFKTVNDSLSHAAGDRVLTGVAERLLTFTRPGDTVARLAGDEFVVLLEDVSGEGAAQVAERVMNGIRVPLVVEGRELVVTASVGIARNLPGDDGESLLRNADIAMYGAKKKGKDRYELYDPRMGVQKRQRLTLENDLRRAVEREEFEVHYQPKLSLLTGRVAGVEALVRWRHPERGLVPPREFITMAEETGLIIPIGLWVLEAACRDARAWQTHLLPDASLDVSVNLSARQFGSKDLVGEVGRVLDRTGLGSTHLTLEITENVIMDDATSTIGTLEELRGLGVQLAIDDFGTGYSSLSYLRRFPLDYLKIDRSFVAGLGEEADASAMVSSIVSLARSLKLTVVAEGVENAEQLRRLKDLGCDLAQGYYLSTPLPAHDVPSFVRTLTDAPVPLRRSHA